MTQPESMFPRLPYLPKRHLRLMPMLLLVLGLAALVVGLLSDNRGLAIMGTVSVAGAGHSVLSSRLMTAPEEEDGEGSARK